MKSLRLKNVIVTVFCLIIINNLSEQVLYLNGGSKNIYIVQKHKFKLS